jgi:competence protein ComEC
MTFGAVLVALAIGDQDSVKQEHWRIFNLTGITHLVSISGSHVTMLAAVGGWCALSAMRRVRWRGRLLCERLPARVIAVLSAMLVAWLYCLLAGWGVPAQRTFFMLACVAVSLLLRHTLSASRVLCSAAVLVVIADPWAPLSTGFWLSFLAVAILFTAGSSAVRQSTRTCSGASPAFWLKSWQLCVQAGRLQWLITVALLPALAFLFYQVSLVSPFANALAIPVLTFVVTPLALGLAVFAVIPGLGELASICGVAAHLALEYTLVPITWLANLSWATFDLAAPPLWTLTIAVVGLCWMLQPPGWPARWAGWFLLLPALSYVPHRPSPGAWRVFAFDVGQGSAALVQTHKHDLLFDTGPRQGGSDAGERILVPSLRALGVRRLTAVVVSHADRDHSGGLSAILGAFTVDGLYSSFSLAESLKHLSPERVRARVNAIPAQAQLCSRGQQWIWDDVSFTFLHPDPKPIYTVSSIDRPAREQLALEPIRLKKGKLSKNDQSCVLHLRGAHHSALLPGDIGVEQEQQLIDQAGLVTPGGLTADLILVPHHGSDTSSSLRFVKQVRSQHAVAQVGYLNRFGHPHPDIKKRWLDAAVAFWQTDRHGAIVAASTPRGLTLQPLSRMRQRYWHQR